MQDDAVGVLIADRVKELLSKRKTKCPASVIAAEASPESFTGEIRKINPSHLIIIDAANFNSEPGVCRIIETNDISGVSFSTHRLPTRIMIDYIQKSVKCEVIVLGVQPKSLKFGEEVTAEAMDCVEKITGVIIEALN